MNKPRDVMQKPDKYNTTKYWYSVQYDEWHGNNSVKKWKVSTSWIRAKDVNSLKEGHDKFRILRIK